MTERFQSDSDFFFIGFKELLWESQDCIRIAIEDVNKKLRGDGYPEPRPEAVEHFLSLKAYLHRLEKGIEYARKQAMNACIADGEP